MENIRKLLGYIRDSFFQLKENIIKWFQSLRPDPETSNDEMPSMQDDPSQDEEEEDDEDYDLEDEFYDTFEYICYGCGYPCPCPCPLILASTCFCK